jgi:uncharacterized protein (DUF427 family)
MVKRIEPRPDQESVWDYPRPPKVEPTAKRIRIIFNGQTIVDTTNALRILETSHPPVYYIPPHEIHNADLQPTQRRTLCEFKGAASYWTLTVGDKTAENVAWSYPNPTSAFKLIKDYLAFYPSRMDACYVNDEQIKSQEGDFYGGWITDDIVGPFKGEPGTMGW